MTKHGREAVVVLGVEEYRRITQPSDLVDFLATSPLAAALRVGELKLTRSPDLGRDAQGSSRRRELCMVSWSGAPVSCGAGNCEPVFAAVGFDGSDEQATVVGRKLGRPR